MLPLLALSAHPVPTLSVAPPEAGGAAPIEVPDYDPARSLAPLVEAVSRAVVTLEVESDAVLPELPPDVLRMLPFDPHDLPQTRSGEGSGFFVSGDGEILTNFHVVEGATQVVAVLADGRRLDATVLGGDRSLDLALLKVDAHEPWVSLADRDDALRVGDWVLAMGNGLGLGTTCTMGIVSARGRAMSADVLSSDFLQIDAAINEGNSGGPVFSLDGTVVGMSTAIITGANTVGFAIPAPRIAHVLDQLRAGRVSRGYLGLVPADAEGGAVVVERVSEDTPAHRAGLEAGDEILAVDGAPVPDARALVHAISDHRPGETVTLTVQRGGKEKRIPVELGERPESFEPEAAQLEVEGLAVSTAPDGVRVIAVDPRSVAHGHLQPGDLILQVNRHKVTQPLQLARLLEHADGDLVFLVVRDGERETVVAPR